MKPESAYPRVRIPYGTWGSSYFPAWQTSPLAEVNIGQFAAEAMSRILGLRKVSLSSLDYLVTGSTIPWHWKFWNSVMLASVAGKRLPGSHIEQACATGLQSVALAAAEVQCNGYEAVGVLNFDRTSDSPVGVFPERRSNQRTIALTDVWDNFGFDPVTENSMLAAAGNVARKHGIDRQMLDELVFHRYQQYFDAKARGVLEKTCVPLDVLDASGRLMGRIDSDVGVKNVSLAALKAMRELVPGITGGGQTHPADGMATLVVASKDKARELSRRPEIDIQLIAKTDYRTGPSLMPEAPAYAVLRLLRQTGVSASDIKVVKSHNPFSVNDAVLAKETGLDWRNMNNTGCSLVWGHPQGPTMTRNVMEALEEAVELGGGYVLVTGCAAGDVGIAALFYVA